MKKKQKKEFKQLVDDLRQIVPQRDRSKLERIERIVGELRRERSDKLAKIADLETQCTSAKSETKAAASANRRELTYLRTELSKARTTLRTKEEEHEESIAKLLQHNATLRDGLYPFELDGCLFVSKEQLIRANEESIRLGFNRNLHEKYLMSLPEQYYFVSEAFYHVGWSGRWFHQLNYRLCLVLCRKLATTVPNAEDMDHALLDVSAEMWEEILKQEGIMPMPNVA